MFGASRRRVLISLALLLAAEVTGAGTAPEAGSMVYANNAGFLANFSGLELHDQDGRGLDPATWAGHMVLFSFIYTGCSNVCPMQTRVLADLQHQLPHHLRAHLQLVSVSIDPRHDTPKVLKAYAEHMGADLSGWSFATGRPEDIERLSETLKLFKPESDARKPVDHGTTLWLTDARGELRMRYSGNPPDVRRLLRDIALLDALNDSSMK